MTAGKAAAQKAAAAADAAADAVRDWLDRRPLPALPPPALAVLEDSAASDACDARDLAPAPPPEPVARPATSGVMRLANTDWLHHRLTVTGPAAALAAFRTTAAGAGLIPWHYDLDRMETDFFHLLMGAPDEQLSVAAARTFARQLRRAVGQRHDLAVTQVGVSRACPLDLHALVPVPATILALGPDEPEALAWLWEHWGTTQPLRQVTVQADQVGLRFGFWSADWTPWRALAAIGRCWPALRFDVRPTYET